MNILIAILLACQAPIKATWADGLLISYQSKCIKELRLCVNQEQLKGNALSEELILENCIISRK